VGKSHSKVVRNMATEIVKADSKGRVIIPERVRKKERIKPGTPLQLVNLGRGVLVLRKLELPSREEILKICRQTRQEIFKEKVEPWLRQTVKSRP
jgi:bifunctional DNA-binding transcriptional regulator/antitoxin component of YhaV-PrlF toxin-antitoxin module